jgi:hypothetical protein
MRIRTEKVTPDRARKWLEATEGFRQRNLSEHRVNRLTHAIRSGQWQVTHQGIAIGPSGEVLDGQHRLTAIILADVPVEVVVAWDADPATFDVIDTGTARTMGDSLRIAGYTNTNHLAAIVRTKLTYDSIAGSRAENWRGAHAEVTTADVLEYLEERREEVLASLAIGARVSRSLARQGLTSTIGTAALMFKTWPTDLGEDGQAEFWERLGDGVLLGPTSPILALRRWFTADTGYARIPNRERRPIAVACTIKAMNDYALGRERSVIVFRIHSEAMPVPVLPGARAEESEALERELARAE